MKISKFVGSVLVALVAVGLVARQQAEASFINMDGIGVSAPPSGGETTFAPHPQGTFVVTSVFGPFGPLFGAEATFKPITWTGSGSSAVLVGGPIIGAWVAFNSDGQAQFDLTSLTFAEATPNDLTLTAKGTVFVTGLTTLPPTPATLTIFTESSFVDFEYNVSALTETTPTPDGGSTLGLLAVGLVGLVAVEGLRRKIATRQNRYA
jgi:hypothetical protein